MKNEDVSKVLNDVQDMKGRQDEMTMKLDQIKRFETFQFITACWGDNPWWGGGGTLIYQLKKHMQQGRVGFLSSPSLKRY